MVSLSNIDLTIPTGDAVNWVFSLGLSLIGHRNLELFLGSRPTLLMLCLNSTLLMQLEGHLEVCYEGDQARFRTWPIGPCLLFDHMPYLLLGVAITPKSELEELQFPMKALLVIQGFDSLTKLESTAFCWKGDDAI